MAALMMAAFFVLEALEERSAAAAANELRVASLTLTSSDHMEGTESTEGMSLQLPTADLELAIKTLQGNHDEALHSLRTDERARVLILLDDLAEKGHSAVHTQSAHTDLHRLLTKAASESAIDADEAEWRAALATVTAITALACAAWALVRDRSRAEKRSIASASEIALGQRLETLLNDLPDMVLVFADSGLITYRSRSTDQLLSGDATAEEFYDLVDESERPALLRHLGNEFDSGGTETFAVRRLDGTVVSLEVRVTDLSDDEFVSGHLVTARDVTAELGLRAELQRQASVDVLTGLPNRRALDPVLDAAHALVAAGDGGIGLLLIDFDGFKEVNDTLGHLIGDQMLREAAGRMKAALRADEPLLRLGGDEFAVVLAPVTDESILDCVASRLRDAMQAPFDIGEVSERIRTSLGGVVLRESTIADELLAKADIALYEAKARGGDQIVLFEPSMEHQAAVVVNTSRALRVADFDREFNLVFQPIVDTISGEPVGLEALLRWHSPTLGHVSPGDFIPIAEQARLMGRVGQWVLERVCRQVAVWEAQGLNEDITVSFNVSAQQLEDDNFVDSVFAAIESSGITPRRLVIEVTESMVVDHDGAIIERLERLRDGGLKISIDDFGSGYSNLGQLLSVPLDIIKIDRDLLLRLGSMREAAGGDPSGPCAIMEAIVSISRMLNAPVICEGVETDVQRMSLQNSGVTYLQGYLTGRPVPPDELSIDLGLQKPAEHVVSYA